tara:strand:+ start:349 stop:894 length:546 start_codon:yes stop_codon:yes gene_type:complete
MLTDKLAKELKEVASNFIPANDLDDLTQEVFLYLLELPADKLEQLVADNQIKYYFIRLCKNNYFSKTSKYHYKYRKPVEKITFTDSKLHAEYIQYLKQDAVGLYFNTDIEDSDLIHNILAELYWYERELFKLYVLGKVKDRGYTYSTLSHKTGISRMSIYTTIKGVKRYVRKRLKEIRNDI